jgi:hypothetical protein
VTGEAARFSTKKIVPELPPKPRPKPVASRVATRGARAH